MVTLGYFVSSEERPARDLVAGAVAAERHGFDKLWISDHIHPWNDAQGNSTFVWSVLGAIAQATESLTATTAVTCPTVRTHPGVVAHAAATVATLMPGRFQLGVGSGEALNEHVWGDPWPSADVRLEMLEEAVGVIRQLWTGDVVHHDGLHYTVDHARLYSLPEMPPPLLMSGFGPKATRLAARIADGYMNASPDGELVELYRSAGGTGVAQAGVKFGWAPTLEEGRANVARLWKNDSLPGELAQLLPTPEHFEQAQQLVSDEMAGGSLACGPDPEPYLERLQAYVDAGFDEIYLSQIGPDQEGFLRFAEKELLPHFS
ncbi:MAG: class F420-dependent oxidoreductase [Mycobacterium sp.]|jgi:G6PDH family F420-dependent oxidoreductase|nr:class F420-dependent oxidoreductase [Mycobacterium sp.]